MRWLRPLALGAVLALVIGSCGTDPGDVAEQLRDVAETAAGEVREAASEAATRIEGAGSPSPQDGAGGGDTSGEATGSPGGATQTNDLGSLGANGPAILRGDHQRLVVEVDVQQGVDANSGALDHLVGVLGSVSDKPGGIALSGGNSFSSERQTWTPGDLRAVADANRSNYSTADTVVIYVLYVDGSFENENALGVAYNASEVALFPERWRGTLADLLGGGRQVEEAVVVHEIGHLLGLVNLTYDSRFGHEDPEHPHHSNNRGSVMYWAIESTAIGQVFSGPPPDDFDEQDRADLRFLRTGSW
ncbi:MAG: hypothetical protein ACRDUY_06305 [Nitriliruptorales bacterium]